MKLLTGNKIKSLGDNQVSLSPSLIMKPPFTTYICASKGSGKSVVVVNLLTNTDMLAGKFNQVYFISPTNKLDEKLNVLKTTNGILKVNTALIKAIKESQKGKRLKLFDDYQDKYNGSYTTSIPEENFIEDVNVDLLNNLIKEQKAVINNFGKAVADTILLIYDDCISAKKFFTSETVQKAIFNSRHVKISLIITSQNYTSLPKCLRLNMSQILLFFTANAKELENIYQENTSGISFIDFKNAFNTVCEKQFNFMVINYQNSSKYRLQNAFENFIQIE
jgi:hypothetical protein